jgi:hypothetical protein
MSASLDPECQEFFGAITLDSYAPLGNRIVTMWMLRCAGSEIAGTTS